MKFVMDKREGIRYGYQYDVVDGIDSFVTGESIASCVWFTKKELHEWNIESDKAGFVLFDEHGQLASTSVWSNITQIRSYYKEMVEILK